MEWILAAVVLWFLLNRVNTNPVIARPPVAQPQEVLGGSSTPAISVAAHSPSSPYAAPAVVNTLLGTGEAVLGAASKSGSAGAAAALETVSLVAAPLAIGGAVFDLLGGEHNFRVTNPVTGQVVENANPTVALVEAGYAANRTAIIAGNQYHFAGSAAQIRQQILAAMQQAGVSRYFYILNGVSSLGGQPPTTMIANDGKQYTGWWLS